jgi:hypothetical protein
MAASAGVRTLSALKFLGTFGSSLALYQTVLSPPVENAIRQSNSSGGLQQQIFQPSALDMDLQELKSPLSSENNSNSQLIEIHPQTDKIRETVEFVTSNPEILSSLLRKDIPHLSPERVGLICDTVVKCFQDDDIMGAIRTKIRTLPAPPPSTTAAPAPIMNNLSDDWADLIGSHKCCMCIDLLAAPCILSCGHSFCGECITNHLNRCVAIENEDGLEISLTCPMCRHEITGRPTFERVLDEDIGNKVQSFPDCPEKRDWSYRRETFKTKLMLNENHKKGKKYQTSEIDMDEATNEAVIAVALAVVIVLVFYNTLLRK